MNTHTDDASLPSATLDLRVVSDSTGVYPELLDGSTVVNSTTAIVLESEAKLGFAMRGTVTIKWNEDVSAVVVEGWTMNEKERYATKEFTAGDDTMQQDFTFTVKCTLSDSSKAATDAPSGWTGPTVEGVWTLDPYVRLKRKGYFVSQTV